VPAESSSIDFLRSKLCVACSRGFEVVSLETLETQPLLDQADTSLDFVNRKEIVPISIERLNGEFLLHYSEYSFFVNRNGWRARPDWLIAWEGRPQTFALSHPYLLAFEPSFIEIRNLETSALVHIVTARNIRMLHSSTREVRSPPCPSCYHGSLFFKLPCIEFHIDGSNRFYTHMKTMEEKMLLRV
jgi:RHO1 GDP-GTP exchange protein 1/2